VLSFGIKGANLEGDSEWEEEEEGVDEEDHVTTEDREEERPLLGRQNDGIANHR
jgi:hypothetical protein